MAIGLGSAPEKTDETWDERVSRSNVHVYEDQEGETPLHLQLLASY